MSQDSDEKTRRRRERRDAAKARRSPPADADVAEDVIDEDEDVEDVEPRPRRKKAKAPKAKAPTAKERPRDKAGAKDKPAKGKGKPDKPPLLDPPGPEHRRMLIIGCLLTTVVAGAFYGSTVCRWIGLGDTALLLDEMVGLQLNSHVNNHKLAVAAGHVMSRLPFGELALRVNLTSVVFGTATMVGMFAIAFRTLKVWWLALLAMMAVMVTHSMWWHSTIVENYAISASLLMAFILLLLRDEERQDSRNFYYATIVAGIAGVNHIQMGALAIATLAYAIAQHKKGQMVQRLAKMAGFYLLGFAPYIMLLVRDMQRAPDAIKILYWAFGGDFGSRMFDFDPGKVFRPLLTEFLIQFPSPLLVFVGLGIYYVGEVSWYPKTNVAITVAFFVNTGFFAQFHTWDKFAFLLQSFLMFGYWAVVGVRCALELAQQREPRARPGVIAALALSVVIPPWVYSNLAKWGAEDGFWHQRFNNNFTYNTHDCAKYISNPNKSAWNDVSAVSELLLEKLPERAIFLDDDARLYYPLHDYYQKHLKRRPDLRFMMTNSWGFSNWGLSEDAFVRLAITNLRNSRVFVIAAAAPHLGTLEKLAAQGVMPQRFELDAHHWVYELVRMPNPPPLVVHDVFTGRDFNAPTPVMKDEFARDETIAVEARFIKNKTTVPITFRWTDPTGRVFFESPAFDVVAGNTNVWSHLEGSGPRPPGAWQVEIRTGETSLGHAAFTVL
jgi:hypothetical protein